jgi:hypothetical protein
LPSSPRPWRHAWRSWTRPTRRTTARAARTSETLERRERQVGRRGGPAQGRCGRHHRDQVYLCSWLGLKELAAIEPKPGCPERLLPADSSPLPPHRRR